MYNALIVDDEPRTITALEQNINWRKCGIAKVFTSQGMQGAIDILEKHRVEILVCDIEMPNGSGMQLLKWIRNQQIKLNCIFVTCHPEFDYMRQAIQLQCYDYILKPIDFEELEHVLTELVIKIESLGNDGSDDTSWNVVQSMLTNHESDNRNRDIEQEVKKYVREHILDNISVEEIAEELHFNPQYLMRVFKSKTDQSIIEYITQTRVALAKKVLKETNLPIKIVAGMVGYDNSSYFAKVFRKTTGKTPQEYRANKQ